MMTLLLAIVLVLSGGDDAGLKIRENPFANQGGSCAIAYGPHRDGQRPGGSNPSAAEIREDLLLMSPHWDLLRIYGAGGCAETLLSVIREEELLFKVMLGVWIAPDDAQANSREVNAAIALAAAYPDIVQAVSVGNETQIFWSAHRSSLDTLIGYVRQVRSMVKIPVTVADDFNFWNKQESRQLAAEIDFITMHAHPMWNGVQLEDAVNWLIEQTSAVREMHPEMEVVIGETGWATTVHNQGEQAKLIKGEAGELQQEFFYDAVRQWSQDQKMTVFFFEAFDENWKGGPHPDEVEKHWGLYRADRTPKAALAPKNLK
jgi:exo-beta-1,3-glucanase (GH17 family)